MKKKTLILFLLLIKTLCFSQKAEFNKINIEKNFTEYISKDKKVIKVGDTISVKFPRSGNNFYFYNAGKYRMWNNNIKYKKYNYKN